MQFHPIADIFPLMTSDEYRALVTDIATYGQREPIWLYEDMVLDGRNRWNACAELGLKPATRAWMGDDPLAFVISLNLHRRHLSRAQRDDVIRHLRTQGMTLQKIAAAVGVSTDTAQRVTRDVVISDFGIENQRGQLRPAHYAPHHEPNAETVVAPVPIVDQPCATRIDAYRIITANWQSAAVAFSQGDVDVIITDPPYAKEHVGLYGLLAEQAARILRPGGSLVVMTGQSYLPDILNAMTPYLRYHWTLAYLTPGGQAVQLWQRNVNTFWKPLLWFVNGEYTGAWLGDVARSAVNDNDKRFHEWGQSVSGMSDIVTRFTAPLDIILDPFCGAGTTGVAALLNGRRFIGVDHDAQSTTNAEQRCHSAVEQARATGTYWLARSGAE